MRKTIGIVVVAALAANTTEGPPLTDDHGDPLAYYVGGERRQPFELIMGEAVFDRHILALDIACVAQTLAERAQTIRLGV